MADFKIVIADIKTGKCVQREIKDKEADILIGMKIGDKVKGDLIGLAGYEFEISGGSDYCGFPMRKDVPGQGRKRILAVEGVGMKKKGKGIKQRKTVCGNTIHAKIAQVNLKIVTHGKEKLFAEKKKEEAKEKLEKKPKEAPKKEAKPKPTKKEETKKEKSKAEEKPKEEVKKETSIPPSKAEATKSAEQETPKSKVQEEKKE